MGAYFLTFITVGFLLLLELSLILLFLGSLVIEYSKNPRILKLKEHYTIIIIRSILQRIKDSISVTEILLLLSFTYILTSYLTSFILVLLADPQAPLDDGSSSIVFLTLLRIFLYTGLANATLLTIIPLPNIVEGLIYSISFIISALNIFFFLLILLAFLKGIYFQLNNSKNSMQISGKGRNNGKVVSPREEKKDKLKRLLSLINVLIFCFLAYLYISTISNTINDLNLLNSNAAATESLLLEEGLFGNLYLQFLLKTDDLFYGFLINIIASKQTAALISSILTGHLYFLILLIIVYLGSKILYKVLPSIKNK